MQGVKFQPSVAVVPMDGTPSADGRTATLIFNLSLEAIHNAI